MKNQHQYINSRRSFLRSTGLLSAAAMIPSFFLSACKKDFLDRQPLDTVTDISFWKTEEQLKLAVNACYSNLRGNNTIAMENMGDNTIYPPNSEYQAISAGNYDFTAGTLNSEWVNLYSAIRRCNHFMENYTKATGIAPAALAGYAGQVQFLRAFMYSYLIFLFGDVPLITKTLDIGDEEVYGPRNKRAEVLDFVLADLDAAAAALPATYASATDLGRITKGAALAWKARVALFFEKWALAEAASKAVMDLNVYALYTAGGTTKAYNDLFTYKGKLSAGANKETILARPYVAGVSVHNTSREIQVPDQTSRYSPTKSLVDTYLCTDGLPIDKSPLYSETSYANIFKNRDPRMAQTILSPGSAWGGQDDGDADANSNTIFNTPKWNADKKGCITGTGYYFTKYVEIPAVGVVSQDSNDIHHIRYAEVLLINAEAKLEQGTLTQADLDRTINLLRDRVGMKRMNIADIAAAGLDLRTEIRRERRVELALEGQRYYDIMRWKVGELLAQDVRGMKKSLVESFNQQYVATIATDANGYFVVNTGRRFVAPKNYLWPIPITQLQKNPALGQNPGW
ncbi:RagB/SusD family nutrient uptake outer membrane protein [Pedobacter sandarakinus]|uniref:RagB/SusD family nutrient uptake outer membrane protein n=1 Tax=Pedobacter sandarakinus TaxID=353156 RepID=UPI002247E208|nr:RagB/SusD family nutrient uptake outer membrane protein [Pedobacter sandarakinus]MCX2575093.1 RagB/SusD family nutrient uptake outer membrane protein [Pedobacter sandarakinus]